MVQGGTIVLKLVIDISVRFCVYGGCGAKEESEMGNPEYLNV